MPEGDILRRIQPGQTLDYISRGTYNAFIDAARAHRRGVHPFAGDPVHFHRSQTVIMVENDEASIDVDQFGILEIDGLVIEPRYDGGDNTHNFLEQPVFKGYVPGYNAHFGWWVVTLEPIAHGEFGKAVVSGITYAKIRKPDQDTGEEPFRFAEVDDGEYEYLRAANGGQAALLWLDDTPIDEEEADDVYWGVICISPHTAPELYAELNEDLAYGNNSGAGAEADLYYQKYLEGDSTHGSLVSTGKTVKVFAPLLKSGRKLASGVRVKLSSNVQSGLYNADDADTCSVPT